MDVLLEIITFFRFKVALNDIKDTCEIDMNDKLANELGKSIDVISLWRFGTIVAKNKKRTKNFGGGFDSAINT